MVKQELYDVALEDALAEWLYEMRCAECSTYARRRAKKSSAQGSCSIVKKLPVHQWREWGHPECDDCFDSFFDECANNLDRRLKVPQSCTWSPINLIQSN